MQLPAGLASLQAGPGPGSQASATCRCEAERAGGGVEAGTPCPLAPGSGRDDGGTGRAPSGEPAETVPGWVVSRGGRWQLLGSEGRKWRQGRDRKGGRQVGEEEEKKGKNWHFRGGLWLRPCAPKAGGPGSLPGQGTRPHVPPLRSDAAK